jgi:hypothetical protein
VGQAGSSQGTRLTKADKPNQYTEATLLLLICMPRGCRSPLAKDMPRAGVGWGYPLGYGGAAGGAGWIFTRYKADSPLLLQSPH